MPQPFNYMLNVPDPMQKVMEGVKSGFDIKTMQVQQQAIQQKAIADQAAREKDIALGKELYTLSNNPSTTGITAMMIRNPAFAEKLKEPLAAISKEEKEARVHQAQNIYSSVLSGDTDQAKAIATEYATAYRNSGREKEAKNLNQLVDTIDKNPKFVQANTGAFLAAALGPEKFAETFSKLEEERRAKAEAPSKLSEAQSKAETAAVGAKFAESNAVKDLEKKGWDITKIKEDIKIAKQNANIAAANVAINRQGNDLKRQELQLKIDDMKMKRDETIRTKASEVESARGTIDNMLNTIERVKNTPMGVVGSAAGPLSSKMPTTSQATADFEELINTLSAQTFMSQIPAMKGTGALSEKEGDKLQASLQSLSLRQSPERLMENVNEAQRLISKGRKALTLKYGVPDTIPDTPQVKTSGADVESLILKYSSPGVK